MAAHQKSPSPRPAKEHKPEEGLRTARTRKRLEPLLRAWHGTGPGEAEAAIVGFLPKTQTLAAVLDSVMAKKLPPYLMDLTRIQEKWTEIAGPVAATKSWPVRIYQGILDVEVSHPAYRAVLMSKKIMSMLLEKVHGIVGPEKCQEIRLIPSGGSAEGHFFKRKEQK